MIDSTGKEIGGGNGEAVKTPEQLKAEKIAAFNANPDAFIHKDNIIIGCVKEGDRVATAVGTYPRHVVEQCLTRLQFMVFSMFLQMEAIKEMQAQASNIVHASGIPAKDVVKKRGLFRR